MYLCISMHAQLYARMHIIICTVVEKDVPVILNRVTFYEPTFSWLQVQVSPCYVTVNAAQESRLIKYIPLCQKSTFLYHFVLHKT